MVDSSPPDPRPTLAQALPPHPESGFALVAVMGLTLLTFLTATLTLAAATQARKASLRSGHVSETQHLTEASIDLALATLNGSLPLTPSGTVGLPAYFVADTGAANTWVYADALNAHLLREQFGTVPTRIAIRIPTTIPVTPPPAGTTAADYRLISVATDLKGIHREARAIAVIHSNVVDNRFNIGPRAITSRSDVVSHGRNTDMLTDSYDSRLGPYSPSTPNTNGGVWVGGNFLGGGVVQGQVAARGVVDANLTVTGAGNTITSGITGNGPQDAPPPPPSTTVAWTPGSTLDAPDGQAWHLGNVTLSGSQSLTLQPGVYVMSSLLITGNQAALNITSNGRVEIYVTGDIQATGQGIVNASQNPTNFSLIATNPTSTVNVAGNANFYGVVYAPGNAIGIGGNGQFFGAVYGDTVHLNGNNTSVHYDEAIGTSVRIGSPIAVADQFRLVSLDLPGQR